MSSRTLSAGNTLLACLEGMNNANVWCLMNVASLEGENQQTNAIGNLE